MSVPQPTTEEIGAMVRQIVADIMKRRPHMQLDSADLTQEAWAAALGCTRYCETTTSTGTFAQVAYRRVRAQVIQYVARMRSPVSGPKQHNPAALAGLRAVAGVDEAPAEDSGFRAERGTPLESAIPSLSGVTTLTPEAIVTARIDLGRHQAAVELAARGHAHASAVVKVLGWGWTAADAARDEYLSPLWVQRAVTRAAERLQMVRDGRRGMGGA